MVATDDEIDNFVDYDTYMKYQNFLRDRLVAKDREHLMFCVKAGCENVLDIRNANGRLLVCSSCE